MSISGLLLQIPSAETFAGVAVAIIILIILASAVKVVREYERVVVFRLGRLIGAKGPGVVIILPVIDRFRKIDLRVLTLDIPKQRIITKDNVTVDVDAVVYFRVNDASQAVVKVQDYILATSLLSQTTLRDVLGQVRRIANKERRIEQKVAGYTRRSYRAMGSKGFCSIDKGCRYRCGNAEGDSKAGRSRKGEEEQDNNG
jgi:regulator of protease activity HflC (stomatin/prohibitin superfamily)